jgi:hypothetical protein
LIIIAGKIISTKDQIETDGILVDHFLGITSILMYLIELLKNRMSIVLMIWEGKHRQDFDWTHLYIFNDDRIEP